MKVCLYYVTLKCNDTCEFCPIWSREEHEWTGGEEQVRKALRDIRIKGVKRLNVTGGEPLLREDLPAILSYAKSLGFQIELTTNGILYAEKAKALVGIVDYLYFSLDYPVASEHDRSRGVECFGEVLAALKLARELKQNPIINFTLTRDSVRFLPEMVELSAKLEVFLHLNPVYDFFGTQGFEPMTLEHIKYYGRRKNVLVNLAALEFIKSGGNRVLYPRCRAKETVITLLPDGKTVSPCFFNPGGRQGGEPVCSSCMRWPYMLPSFAVRWDRYFWLNLFSEEVKKRRLKK